MPLGQTEQLPCTEYLPRAHGRQPIEESLYSPAPQAPVGSTVGIREGGEAVGWGVGQACCRCRCVCVWEAGIGGQRNGEEAFG